MTATGTTASSNTAVENYRRKPRIVASRPDYLTVSLPDKLQEYLPDLLASFSALMHETGKGDSVSTAYDWHGERLYLQRDGKGMPRLVAKDYCELRFYNKGGRVSAQFTVYSAPFWMDDAQSVFLYAWGLICEICGREVSPVPARLDLARDVHGFNLDKLNSLPSLRRHFVTRSRKRKAQATIGDDYLIEGASTVESVYLGSPAAPVRWNIYDKTKQAAKTGKTYYQPVWSESPYYNADARVVRFEARLTGRVWQELARHGVKNGLPPLTLENLADWLTPLWSWLTQSHTRMVIPDAKQTNRSRLKTSPFWAMMGQAFDDNTTCVPLQRERVRQPSREALGAQSEGALLSLAAMSRGAENWTPQEIAASVLDLVGWRCGKTSQTWRTRVLERRALLAVS